MDNGGMKKKERRDVARPPRLRSIPAMPTGPRMYRTPKDLGYKGPVSVPPPGFVIGTTSVSEWVLYWAVAKVMGVPEDPRLPPFIGYPGVWSYQQNFAGGRHTPGGAVIDYVIHAGKWNDMDIGIRLQTERFHLYNDTSVHAHDALQLAQLSTSMKIIDIFDQDYIWDPTGQVVIILLKDSLAGHTIPSPLTAGTTERGTRVRAIST